MAQGKAPKSTPPQTPPPKPAPKIAPDPKTMTTGKREQGNVPGKETRIIQPGK